MPPLGISSGSTVYGTNVDATLLQAGGLELLDVETLDRLREVNQLQHVSSRMHCTPIPSCSEV